MALTIERYAEIDTELQEIQEWLADLADEIDADAPCKNDSTRTAVVYARGGMTRLRFELKQQQEHERIGDEVQCRLYGGRLRAEKAQIISSKCVSRRQTGL